MHTSYSDDSEPASSQRLADDGACASRLSVGEALRRLGTRAPLATTSTMTYWIIHYPRDATTDRENVCCICVCYCSTSAQTDRPASAPVSLTHTHTYICVCGLLGVSSSSSVYASAAATDSRPPPAAAYQYCWLYDPWHSARSSPADRLFANNCLTSATQFATVRTRRLRRPVLVFERRRKFNDMPTKA